MTRNGNSITFLPEEAESLSGRISDGLCFLAGWEAAKDGSLPAELVALRIACRDINLHLKQMEWGYKRAPEVTR